MKTKLFFIAGIIVLLSCTDSFCQNDTDTLNLHKYWGYRDRFRKLFIRIGDKPKFALYVNAIKFV